MSLYKSRFTSLLKALSDEATTENSLPSITPSNLWIVGRWSLAHQNVLEKFGKSHGMVVSHISNSSEMLQLAQEIVHLPYSSGVLACHADDDKEDALRLLKFFNKSHPDGVLKLIFTGSSLDVESALYLDQQSAGYKQLPSNITEGFEEFLVKTLQSSIWQRSELIESLIGIAKLISLTPKEIVVMAQILSGFANKEIAAKMENSSRTIEILRASIFDKLDVKNAIELSMFLHSVIRS